MIDTNSKLAQCGGIDASELSAFAGFVASKRADEGGEYITVQIPVEWREFVADAIRAASRPSQVQGEPHQDLAQQIKSIADDCREDFNTCPQCGYEDHTAIKNSNLLLLIDSALSDHPANPQPVRAEDWPGFAEMDDTPATLPRPALSREEGAKILWHRFAPDHHIEWEDESHKAEYLAAYDAILSAQSQGGGS